MFFFYCRSYYCAITTVIFTLHPGLQLQKFKINQFIFQNLLIQKIILFFFINEVGVPFSTVLLYSANVQNLFYFAPYVLHITPLPSSELPAFSAASSAVRRAKSSFHASLVVFWLLLRHQIGFTLVKDLVIISPINSQYL